MKMNLTFSGKRRDFARRLLMSLLFGLLMLPVRAQERVTVSGRLTDTGQNPLIGASVIEAGTTNGVTTAADGSYRISVGKDATLEFSYIGYKPQRIEVMNRTEINVTLEEETTMIGEVVAIGYGSQRKEDLSMAVTTVKVDDAARSRASDLGTLLQGRMPGVTVMQSGDPMQKASFSIRGRGSKGQRSGNRPRKRRTFVGRRRAGRGGRRTQCSLHGRGHRDHHGPERRRLGRHLRRFGGIERRRADHHPPGRSRQDARQCERIARIRTDDESADDAQRTASSATYGPRRSPIRTTARCPTSPIRRFTPAPTSRARTGSTRFSRPDSRSTTACR